jgi:hypothetical protein
MDRIWFLVTGLVVIFNCIENERIYDLKIRGVMNYIDYKKSLCIIGAAIYELNNGLLNQ